MYFLGVGSGVTVLNNLAQIGIALGVDDTTTLLCVFSFFNFAGRLGSGAVSEYFVRSLLICFELRIHYVEMQRFSFLLKYQNQDWDFLLAYLT